MVGKGDDGNREGQVLDGDHALVGASPVLENCFLGLVILQNCFVPLIKSHKLYIVIK